MIQRVLLAEGLPLDLAYIPIVESAFKPEAVSRAGAKGLWQFMRGTAIEQGLRYDWAIDERTHPEKSTAAAIKYLKQLNAMFDGDWPLTLASYNGGPGRVRRAMRTRQTSDYWPLAAQRRALPKQTREYVPMVLAAMVIGRNPAQYGFTMTPAERPVIDAVSVDLPTDLGRVAGRAGVPVENAQRLNLDLRRADGGGQRLVFRGTDVIADRRRVDAPRHPLDRLFAAACGDTRLPGIDTPR
jgi:membrane-bound lytic murein transglycosylase D